LPLRPIFCPEDGNSIFVQNAARHFSGLHDITVSNTVIFTLTAVKTPNVTKAVKLNFLSVPTRSSQLRGERRLTLLRLMFPLQVEESQLRLFPHRDRERLTAQLMLDIVDLHIGSEGRLELTCLSTIPGFLAPEQSEYADRKMSSVTGMVQDMSCPTCQMN
jgi:hypothetical protein